MGIPASDSEIVSRGNAISNACAVRGLLCSRRIGPLRHACECRDELLATMIEPRRGSDRRVGPSWLSTWTSRRIVALWIIWPGSVLALCVIGILLSIRFNGGLGEARADITRSKLMGLGMIAIVPPAYLTALWWRMQNRRRSGNADRRGR